jgi:hypothetical protein
MLPCTDVVGYHGVNAEDQDIRKEDMKDGRDRETIKEK